MTIRIQPAALADLADGYRFYEAREAGIGSYFLDSLYSDIDSLQIHAGIHAVHVARFHRLLSKRFPYAVYYEMKDGMILVRAVLDLRRNPEWIVRKLKGLP